MLHNGAPPPFIQTPGQYTIPYRQWKRSFDNYLTSIGGSIWDEHRKIATLLTNLGQEGQRLYYASPGSEDDQVMAALTYTQVEARIVQIFAPKINPIVADHQFRIRKQLPGESIDLFIAGLRELLASCEYGNIEDRMVVGQLIAGTTRVQIRNRLLSEPPATLTLQKALEICRQIERAEYDSKQLLSRPQSESTPDTVSKITRSKGDISKQVKSSQIKPSLCSRCGYFPNHGPSYENCPARKASCNRCGRTGHFSKVCRSKGKGKTQPAQVRTLQPFEDHEFVNKDVFNAQCENKSINDVQLLNVQAHPLFPCHIRCEITFKTLANSRQATCRMIYDPGSPITTIPYAWFKAHFGTDNIKSTNTTLKTYNQTVIQGIVGRAVLQASYNQEKCKVNAFVIHDRDGLIGLDLIQRLGLNLEARTLTVHSVTADQIFQSVDQVLEQYPLIFSKDLGRAKGFQHTIRLKPGCQPVQKKKRAIPIQMRSKVTEELKELAKAGVIEPIDSSEWVHPLVVVAKPDGRVRITCDLRELNPYVIGDKYPLPTIEEMLTTIPGATWFTKLDMAKAFYHMELDIKSRPLTAFLTDDGLFQHKRLPMGLKSSPSAFQKMMSTIFSCIPNVLVYIDDILVFGRTKEEHDKALHQVLQQLTKYNLRLEPTKCRFFTREIEFLGHKLSSEGISPLEKNTNAIINAPKPETYKALHAFLGSCSYHLGFLSNFAQTSEPLWQKLRGKEKSDAPIPSWTVEDDKAFQTLKTKMSHPPVLAYFRPNSETYVVTDASDYGLGAVLMQIQEGKPKIIRSVSHTLTNAERKYSIGEKEALACVWACERWHVLLWGRPFKLVTDHKANETLLNRYGTGRKPSRIARWYERLSKYDYTIMYKPGNENFTADFLSRMPMNTGQPISDPQDFVINMIHNDAAMSLSEIARETDKDLTLSKVKSYIVNGWPNKVEAPLARFKSICHQLYETKGCVAKDCGTIILPESLQQKALSLAHEGHPGIVKTKLAIRPLYWWIGMDTHVEELVKHCIACQSTDKSAKPRAPPLQPIPFPNAPWQTLSLDIAGPYKTDTQSRFVLALTDLHSKWIEASLVATTTSTKVILFLNTVFAIHGLPTDLITDNGQQFLSTEFQQYLSNHGIKHHRTTVYNPQSNAPIERVNRIIKEAFQVASYEHRPWKEALSKLLQRHRSTPSRATGYSPWELLNSRQMRTKLNRSPKQKKIPIKDLQHRVRKYQQQYKQYHDAKHRVSDRRFHVGDYVKHKLPQVVKGESAYSTPKKIIEVKGSSTYKLEDGRIWNARRLVPTIEPPPLHVELDTKTMPQFRLTPFPPRFPEPQPTPLRREQLAEPPQVASPLHTPLVQRFFPDPPGRSTRITKPPDRLQY